MWSPNVFLIYILLSLIADIFVGHDILMIIFVLLILNMKNGICDSRGFYVCIHELVNLTGSSNSYR